LGEGRLLTSGLLFNVRYVEGLGLFEGFRNVVFSPVRLGDWRHSSSRTDRSKSIASAIVEKYGDDFPPTAKGKQCGVNPRCDEVISPTTGSRLNCGM
jgi:hypothetical protein